MAGRLETKQYWIDQLSEYWDSGFSIQEYCELKELPFENTKRWIRVFEKERNGVPEKSPVSFHHYNLDNTFPIDFQGGKVFIAVQNHDCPTYYVMRIYCITN